MGKDEVRGIGWGPSSRLMSSSAAPGQVLRPAPRAGVPAVHECQQRLHGAALLQDQATRLGLKRGERCQRVRRDRGGVVVGAGEAGDGAGQEAGG
jgi:hypothetical protein